MLKVSKTKMAHAFQRKKNNHFQYFYEKMQNNGNDYIEINIELEVSQITSLECMLLMSVHLVY